MGRRRGEWGIKNPVKNNNRGKSWGEEWVLPSDGLMGLCHWMGSHFQNWIDYYGVAFLEELLKWGRTFSGFWGQKIQVCKDLKIERFTPH